jgi:RNA polymerase sigma factor (TIGR02999 family)
VSDEKPTASAASGHVDSMVTRAEAGDPAAKDTLFSALYSELHRLAEAHIRRSAGPLTIGATTLLHEAYLNLNGRDSIVFPDRHRFMKYASRAMRGLIINYVQRRRAQKRGGEITFTDLDEETVGPQIDVVQLPQLGEALDDLAAIDASLAELVDLKFFCGFSFGDIAIMRGVSERTVQRDWAKARVLLHDALALEDRSDASPR